MKPAISGRRIRSCMPIQAPKEKPATQQPAASGWTGLRPVERRGRIGQFAGAMVERALAPADAAEVEPQHREAALGEHVEQLIGDLVVHRPAELRVRMKNDGDRRGPGLARLVTALKAAGGASERQPQHLRLGSYAGRGTPGRVMGGIPSSGPAPLWHGRGEFTRKTVERRRSARTTYHDQGCGIQALRRRVAVCDRIAASTSTTTPALRRRPEARTAMVDALDGVGNASSVHGEGRGARRRIENGPDGRGGPCRRRPAPRDVSSAAARRRTRRSCSPNATIERAVSVRFERGCWRRRDLGASVGAVPADASPADRVEPIAVDGEGRIDEASLAAAASALAIGRWGNGPGLGDGSQQRNRHAQPVGGAARRARPRRTAHAFHCDAAQAVGRVPVDLNAIGSGLPHLLLTQAGQPQAPARSWRARGRPRPCSSSAGQERGAWAGPRMSPPSPGPAPPRRLLRPSLRAPLALAGVSAAG